MKTKPTKTESLMRIRARRRIWQVLEQQLATAVNPLYARGSPWIHELIETGVPRAVIEKVAEEVMQKLRGHARSVRP